MVHISQNLNILNINKKIDKVSKDNCEYFKWKEDHDDQSAQTSDQTNVVRRMSCNNRCYWCNNRCKTILMEALFIPLNILNMNKKIEKVLKDNYEYFQWKEDDHSAQTSDQTNVQQKIKKDNSNSEPVKDSGQKNTFHVLLLNPWTIPHRISL